MEKISKYEVQANEFMVKNNVTMGTKLLGNYPYFDDDKESRDVYQITLKRGHKSFQFRFGQSITKSTPAIKKKKVELQFNGEYFAASKIKYISPTPYDILSCLQKNDPGTFDNFCYDFGYDSDSRRAGKTYFDIQKEWVNVNRMFGDVMDELQEIQ